MKDYINIGSSPSGEDCAQVGSDDYTHRASVECRIFADQLDRSFPDIAKNGCSLAIKSFPHDFGSYKEVVIYFDDENEASESYAIHIENNTPEFWDDLAKGYLKSYRLIV